eukprot:COSAG01_NODE_31088_length_604_cov_0.736634_1_plen_44_part_10
MTLSGPFEPGHTVPSTSPASVATVTVDTASIVLLNPPARAVTCE